MAITYEWVFPGCNVTPSQDGMQNIVTAVDWRLIATDSEANPDTGEPYKAECYGTVGLAALNTESFIAFSDLPYQQIVDWVIDRINTQKRRVGGVREPEIAEETIVEQLMRGLAGQIELQRNPPPTTPRAFQFSA